MQNVKGTRNEINYSEYSFLIDLLKEKLNFYSFNEIKVPIIEQLDIFQRSLGITTDIIKKEMFLIKNIHEDKESLCLRPEITTSIVKAYLTENVTISPWLIYSIGQVFRYERPQKGRYREFSQCSIEAINAKSELYDAQLIKILDSFFTEIGIKNYYIEINFIGNIEDRKKYWKSLSEYAKAIYEKTKNKQLKKMIDLNVFRLLDAKDPEIIEHMKNAPSIIDYLCKESKESFEKFKELLKTSNIEYVQNFRLMRGLDYYNDSVFEFKSNDLGTQNSFCAGGRYDGLASILGSKKEAPAVGAAIGLERMFMLANKKTSIRKNVGIIVSDEKYLNYAFQISESLSKNEIENEIYADRLGIKKGLQKANKDGTKIACIIGDEEFEDKSVSIKNLVTGRQIITKYNNFEKRVITSLLE
jgi:histidyl-tRNA synthetase